jgi:2-haloacid dehalogenase
VVSGEEGILKPSPELFERLIRRFELDPPATLFVDDVEANVEGARSVGLRGHHFSGAERLAAHLDELGLLGRAG